MQERTKEVTPFTIKEKGSQYYVSGVTNTDYFTIIYREETPTVFTSKILWNKIKKNKFWKENFIAEQVKK